MAEYMSVAAFGQKYGYSKKTVLGFIADGRLPATRPLGAGPNVSYRIRVDDAQEFMREGAIASGTLLCTIPARLDGQILTVYYEEGVFRLRREQAGHPMPMFTVPLEPEIALWFYMMSDREPTGTLEAPFPYKAVGSDIKG